MGFSVQFKSIGGYVVFIDPDFFGWEDLDEVCNSLRIFVPYQEIFFTGTLRLMSYTVKVPEKMILSIPYFRARQHIRVNVPEDFLNQFVVWKVVNKFPRRKLVVDPVIDNEKLLKSWVDAGTPLDWNISEDDLTEYVILEDFPGRLEKGVSAFNLLSSTSYREHKLEGILPLKKSYLRFLFLPFMCEELINDLTDFILALRNDRQLANCGDLRTAVNFWLEKRENG